MDGPSRSGGFRQSRRSRSQRDRERRRRRADLEEPRASSPSSASDQELCRGDSLLRASGGECRPGFPGARHRPPRRRKRESVSCEEDIIDGFAIASFISLEALEMDCSLKPPERSGLLISRGSKRKRGLDENGGPLSEPEEGPPATYTNSWEQRRKIKSKLKRNRDAKLSGNHMETGYICDTESESGDKASDNMEPAFIVCTREAVNSNSASAAVGNGCPLLPSNSSLSLLSVTPRVSGLERSQERSMEQPYPEPISTSSSLPSLAAHSTASVSNSLPEQRNGNGGPHHRHNPSPQHKHKPFLPFPGKSQSIYSMASNNRSSTSGKPPSSSASSSSIRPPTPASSVSLVRGPGGVGTVRPSSRPSPGAVFTPSPSLPPPPPLMQVSPHPSTDQDPTQSNASASGGPSVSSSSSGTSSRSSQAQTSIPTMAYQFHQHNHQHQHTHTHQHFLHPTAAPQPLFEKYPGKIDSLFRHPFFPQYPPSVPGIQPVLPPTGPFSSLHGAFQPKLVALQGAAPEMTSGLGVVPPHLQPKATRLTDPFAPPPKVSNKPGKWCAMHVRVAWMILRHQEKVKLMHADPQKLDFRNDPLPRLTGPGIGGLGGLGPLGGSLTPTHDLTRPGSLFAAAGGVNPSSTPFMPPSTPHSFLSPAAHLEPYVRSPPFSLGALGSSAFGGLGSPTIAASVFGHKTEPSASAVGGLGNPHDPWNRLHVAPASFPSGSSWAKGPEKKDDRGKEVERRELTHIKDEKDRDSFMYGRPPVRMSPGVPSIRHRSNTPSSHTNGLGALSVGGVPSDGQSRERERERESDKRQHSASRGPGSSSSVAPDRPRSSTSSILTTSPSNVPLAPSPLDLFHRQPPHTLSTESNHSSQRENNGPASSSSSSSLPVKKPDRTTTPVSKPVIGLPTGLLLPQVKVKEERKEEPEPVPISIPHSAVTSHNFERPSSRHTHHPSTPSSTLSLTPTPGIPLPPPTPHPPHHPLSLLDRTRAIDAYLGGAGGSAGLVLGAAADRFPPHPHGPPQGHSQATHSFPWDPWRDLAAQQQQQQQRREILTLRSADHLALRSDQHLSRLLQHQQVQRLLEAERAAVAAAVASSPHHPPVPTSTSSASASAGRPEFGLMSHPFDEEQRAQIMREDFERARYFGMHPHPHLSAPHLPSPSHAAHLEQLHAGLLSHSHLHPAGASAQASHHPGLYSRLGPLHSHSHVPNGILTKTPGLVGALSVGAPPPLIPSVNRSSTPPRGSRLGGAGDLALFTTHKDGESR
ncbi:autism susceptibility gene 2 protein homolog isoform X1 [Ctenopharyngodon idella]|uniref:autism susceptibility gene 2 protein homolog isoform X1 n=1 Tax=Ctenopharyngodon idella TaxID=7959 RepID=UPI00222EC5F9|nr:autism susceptibility gene 2 protein homolog isoform X1 [Ctenopharyngodon idella]